MTRPPVPHPALFLDRDGIINEEVGYLHRPEDVRFVPGFFSLGRTAMRLGYRLVVITNQSGIARGLYSEADFHHLMRFIRAQLAREDVLLDAVYHCPWHPTHGTGHYAREHEDRKPSPGMLHRAARDLSLDLSRSVMVGDRCSDIAAGNAAHLRAAFLLAGTEPDPCPGPHTPITTLAELEHWLVRNPPEPPPSTPTTPTT